MKPNLKNIIEIPEHIIVSAAAAIIDDEENSFVRLLKAGQEFKEAEMTPIYILDRDTMEMLVAAQETLGKKLH